MFSWFASKSVNRTAELLKDPFGVYDLTFLEWEQRQVLAQQVRVYICVNKSRNSNKSPPVREIIFKKDRLSIFCLYRNVSKEEVQTVFNSVHNMLNNVSSGITTKNPTLIAPILRDIMISITSHPNWTTAHIAAKAGLDKLFTKCPPHIKADLNAQNKPDLLTPLHLVIQSERVTATKAVLALKPRIDLRDKKGNCAIHYAAMSQREILSLILKNPNMLEMLKWKNYSGCTPLHLACFSNKTDNVIEFLTFGMTVQMMILSKPERSLNQENVAKSSDEENERVIHFTKEDIDDLDTEDMKYGGTPLHWVKHRRTLEKLVSFGFEVDVININGETALYTMVKRLRLKCMIGLLCFGAKVQHCNRLGDSPLHCAVKAADVTATQALIIFEANTDVKNNKKESVRHIAAKLEQEDHNMILYLLSAIGAKRCNSRMKGCKPGCAYNGKYDGKPYYRWPRYDNESFYKHVLLEAVIREELHRKSAQSIEESGEKSRNARMICLDGGGVRGLITIQMLIEMERLLKKPISEYFDWITGTSTGSIVGMLLATNRPLNELRRVYFRFKDKIFVGSRPYSTKDFESLLEEELGSDMKMWDLFDKYGKKVIINATLIDRDPAHLHRFRSYESPHEILGLPETPPGLKVYPNCKDQIAWQSCRASGAAPTYFRASGAFLDGGLIANNPTLDALSEFKTYNNSLKAVGRSDETQELELVVSFGTGRFPIIQTEPVDVVRMWTINPREIHKNTLYIKQLGNLMLHQVTNTEEHIIDRAQSWCSWIKCPYFRVNPPLSEPLTLDETSDVEICNALWETKAYMYAMKEQVDVIVQLLTAHEEENISKRSEMSTNKSINSESNTGYNLNISDNNSKTQPKGTTNNLNSSKESRK